MNRDTPTRITRRYTTPLDALSVSEQFMKLAKYWYWRAMVKKQQAKQQELMQW